MDIKINELEVMKLNLQKGDVLMVKLRGTEFLEQRVMDSLKDALATIFPGNQIAVLGIPDEHDLTMEVVKRDQHDIFMEAAEKVMQEQAPVLKKLAEYEQKERELSVKPVKDCSQPAKYCGDCGCGKKEAVLAELEAKGKLDE